ncbi:Zinc finger, RanBP2-type [Corchorus olitorius]|uniref:RBR-type E3 ubiquitin transferase n=1 Tax=Corchorus olitorius TaxID=93759 RepID=A0A1R3HXD8_9ROSI|nr:Zinc finger, RanBP2-type [Corchorus olitorius]
MAASDDEYLSNDDGDDDSFHYYDAGSEDELIPDACSDGYEDEDQDQELSEEEADSAPRLHDNRVVLTEADIRQRIKDHIDQVSTVLSISKDEASILLLHYNWSASKVHDEWFLDENGAREKAGLPVKPLVELSDDKYYELSDNKLYHDEILCGICFDTYPLDGIKSTSCGHPYCNECWSCYIKTAIADGPGCLFLRCPEPSCNAAVTRDLVGLFASEEEKSKYSNFFVTSYIEVNRNIKNCPGAGCENAIEFVGGCGSNDVFCSCTHSFCWNCTEEAHRPVDCETAKNWMAKNSSEAENVNYILAFTKPCPKCRKPIEKNLGCNHMTCRAPCHYQFCWLCLEDWKSHRGSCNRFREEEYEKREKAKKYLVRYTHFYERWATNQNSMKRAIADMKRVEAEQIDILVDVQEESAGQLKFLTEAWQQIVECRKILSWTYAFGYYLSDEDPAKRNLFEDLQDQAETGLERLHACAEKELKPFLEHRKKEFIAFREKLSKLTGVTKTFFDNLVAGLENGLAEVNSIDAPSASKKARRDQSKKTAIANRASAALSSRASAALSRSNAASQSSQLAPMADRPGPWSCAYCTLVNDEAATSCKVCGTGRGSWSCDRCTFANPRTVATCQMCSEADDI